MGEETRPVQFQIPAKELADLEQWARNSERPLDELLGDAVHAYVERQRAFVAAVEEARWEARVQVGVHRAQCAGGDPRPRAAQATGVIAVMVTGWVGACSIRDMAARTGSRRYSERMHHV